MKEHEWSDEGADDQASVMFEKVWGKVATKFTLVYQRGEDFECSVCLYDTAHALPYCVYESSTPLYNEPGEAEGEIEVRFSWGLN